MFGLELVHTRIQVSSTVIYRISIGKAPGPHGEAQYKVSFNGLFLD